VRKEKLSMGQLTFFFLEKVDSMRCRALNLVGKRCHFFGRRKWRFHNLTLFLMVFCFECIHGVNDSFRDISKILFSFFSEKNLSSLEKSFWKEKENSNNSFRNTGCFEKSIRSIDFCSNKMM